MTDKAAQLMGQAGVACQGQIIPGAEVGQPNIGEGMQTSMFAIQELAGPQSDMQHAAVRASKPALGLPSPLQVKRDAIALQMQVMHFGDGLAVLQPRCEAFQ